MAHQMQVGDTCRKLAPRRTVITINSTEYPGQCTVHVAYTRRTIEQAISAMPFLIEAASILRDKAATLKTRWRAKVLEEWAAALDGTHDAVQNRYFWRFSYIQWALNSQNWSVYRIDRQLWRKLAACREKFEQAIAAMGIKVFQPSVCTSIDAGARCAEQYRAMLAQG